MNDARDKCALELQKLYEEEGSPTLELGRIIARISSRQHMEIELVAEGLKAIPKIGGPAAKDIDRAVQEMKTVG